MQPLADYIDHTVRRLNPWRRPPVAIQEPDDNSVELPTLRTNPNTLESKYNHARTALESSDTPETRSAYLEATALLQYRRQLELSELFQRAAREIHTAGNESRKRFANAAHDVTRIYSEYWRQPPSDPATARQRSEALAENVNAHSEPVTTLLENRADELAQLARNHAGRVQRIAEQIHETRAEQIRLTGTPVAPEQILAQL